MESESNPASPSEHSDQPPIPKLDFSSLTVGQPDSPLPKTKMTTVTSSPPPPPISHAITSENESQPEGDLTVVNTPRTSPDCEDAKARSDIKSKIWFEAII